MKLVVDSNVIFTFFWKNAIATDLFVFQDVELYTPEFTLKEIEKYSKEIMKKGKIEQKEFIDVKKELQMLITFVSLEKYKELLEKALNVTPDPDDVDFFALALKMNLPIWSNDKKLKQQNIVKILTTKEVIELFD
ncbi:MAG: PIN domain-containing protein [Nanoarchaeota archaeon]